MGGNNTRITNGFQFGLLGGLGVITALLIGNALTTIAGVITYVAAALFLALGLEPLVASLVRRGLKRPLAVLAVIGGLLLVLAGIVVSIIPALVSEGGNLAANAPRILTDLSNQGWVTALDSKLGGSIHSAIDGAATFLSDSKNWPSLAGGVVQVGLSLLNGFSGLTVIFILTIFFMASLVGFKQWIYSLIPTSRRTSFKTLAEEIFESIGRYVMGQVGVALLNGLLAFIMMSIMQVPFALILAFIEFLLALIPLVGSLSGALLVTLVALTHSPTAAIVMGIYYIIYMQLEAYVIGPRVMRKAVSVPGAVVVVAALAGGTLLGVLGALVAIPVAASVMLIIKQVWIPRQDAR
jgi:predicted PurR-regulated permease PerM